jgi:hypothetical protein
MKQGAKSEELITNPEERIEVAPDWVAKVGEEPAASAEPVPPAAEAPSTPQVEQGADMDWLAGLTAETIMPEGQPAEPASVAPESALPDWLSDATKPEEQPSSAPMPWEIPAEPGATQPMEPAEPVSFGPPAAETPAPADDWFASLEQPETQKPSTPMPWEQEAPTEAAEPVPWEQPAETPAPAEAQTSTDVSGWLDSLAQEEAPAAETPPTEAAVPRDEFPSWLESMPAAVPSVQPAPAESEELPDWLKDMSADEQPPVPEQVSEWMPAQETPAPPVSGVPVQEPPTQPQPASAAVAFEAPATAPVEESAPPPPLQLRSTAAAGDKDEHFINSARDYLTKGSLNEAMAEYSKLIKKNRLLEEVIYDLQEIVYSHPVDVIVWQTLGDAHMRSNRLQEALDAYTKAEELLR